MKLVEILALELSEWPLCVVSMSQDSDLQVSHYERKDQIWSIAYDGSWNNDGYLPLSRFTVSGFATDHATAMVTREMWEAERARMVFTDISDDFNPVINRDRIRAIDVQLADLTLERAERIAELAAEGFALLPVVDAVGPAWDIEDWRDWQAGDLLEVVRENDARLPVGGIYPIRSIEVRDYDGGMPVSVFTTDGERCWPEARDGSRRIVFKFHSR
jgi:hypothetical protein